VVVVVVAVTTTMAVNLLYTLSRIVLDLF